MHCGSGESGQCTQAGGAAATRLRETPYHNPDARRRAAYRDRVAMDLVPTSTQSCTVMSAWFMMAKEVTGFWSGMTKEWQKQSGVITDFAVPPPPRGQRHQA